MQAQPLLKISLIINNYCIVPEIKPQGVRFSMFFKEANKKGTNWKNTHAYRLDQPAYRHFQYPKTYRFIFLIERNQLKK